MPNGASRLIQYSSCHSAEIQDVSIPDIDADPTFREVFSLAREYTMTDKVVMNALYQAARYVALSGIPGDFVECGVWRGGSALLAALTLRKFEKLSRRLWLYDTYEGMTAPSDIDIDIEGHSAKDYIEKYSDAGRWCYADLDDVRTNLALHGITNFKLVKGDVLDTLRLEQPEIISILRLDTDWYESTKFELEVLYPRLATGGVLIIDDYGHWQGSRRAVDEYFAKQPLFLSRINYAVRVAIKP